MFAIRNRNYNLQKYGYISYVNTSKCSGMKTGKVGKNEILYMWVEINNSCEEQCMLLTFNNTDDVQQSIGNSLGS